MRFNCIAIAKKIIKKIKIIVKQKIIKHTINFKQNKDYTFFKTFLILYISAHKYLIYGNINKIMLINKNFSTVLKNINIKTITINV